VTAPRSPSVAARRAASDEKSKTHEERPILAFDTSGPWCAAALLLPDRVIQRHELMEKGQAERLMPLLEEVLAEGGIAWSDLGALAVGTGPGNFTGVRIAVAAARGLALGLGIPAVGVTRLEALAYGLPRPVLVVEDARRGEVYAQEFLERGPDAAELTEVLDITLARGRTAFVGSAGAEMAKAWGQQPVQSPYSLAEAIARIGAARAATPQPRPAPFYLRGADAAPPADPPPVILP
jgi:tRNA threonylcarbamoyladenosine biosynthesis protein TsaB